MAGVKICFRCTAPGLIDFDIDTPCDRGGQTDTAFGLLLLVWRVVVDGQANTNCCIQSLLVVSVSLVCVGRSTCADIEDSRKSKQQLPQATGYYYLLYIHNGFGKFASSANCGLSIYLCCCCCLRIARNNAPARLDLARVFAAYLTETSSLRCL